MLPNVRRMASSRKTGSCVTVSLSMTVSATEDQINSPLYFPICIDTRQQTRTSLRNSDIESRDFRTLCHDLREGCQTRLESVLYPKRGADFRE